MARPPFSPGRAALVLCFLLALAAASFLLAIALGEQPISLGRALEPSSSDAVILFSLRLPRASLAALVGATLAAAGCTLQGLLRNPLADPFVLGASGGAALMATLAMALGLGAVGTFAFLGALGATALVTALGRATFALSPQATLLAGVIFNSFSLGAITFFKVLAAPDRLGETLYWLAGALGYPSLGTLFFASLFAGAALLAMWLLAGRLNLLMLGDEDAATLGVPVARTRLLLLLAASLAVSVSVALAGLVGFVGLIVPHLLRLWLGPDQRLLLPASALGGALFLLLADLAARLLFTVFGGEPPVGAVTALMGGPFFLGLLVKQHRPGG